MFKIVDAETNRVERMTEEHGFGMHVPWPPDDVNRRNRVER